MPKASEARVAVLVKHVPSELREAADRAAAATGDSLNNTLVRLLAARYGVPFTPTRYPRTLPAAADTWVLRMPAQLRSAIAAHAKARKGDSSRGVILMTLAEALDCSPISPRRAA